MPSDVRELRRSFDGSTCSIKRTLDIVGEPWSLLILREAFWGVRRFQDFQSFLGLPRAVLTKRLEKFIAHGILQRSPYQDEGARARHEYMLTKAGIELFTALLALNQWGDKHLGMGPVRMIDKNSGKRVSVQIVDDNNAPVAVERVRPTPRKRMPSSHAS
jgi:DNA-binding HxlR family transcriptional regulator